MTDGSDRSFSGRYGWECPDCGAAVSLWDREFHRNVICSGDSDAETGGTQDTGADQ